MEIIYSSVPEFIGWTAPDGHPVQVFYASGQESYVGEIREDTETGELFKYGYYRLENDDFIQIGFKAETISAFLNTSDMDYLLNRLKEDSDVEDLHFISNDLKIIHSTNPDALDVEIDDPKVQAYLMSDDIQSYYVTNQESDNLYYVFASIYDGDEKAGNLVIAKSTAYIEAIEREIKNNGYTIVGLILSIFAIAIMMIYKRSKSFLNLAYYDKTTHLPNDLYLKSYLEESMVKSGKKAIFLIDIKNFKTINLTYGYEYGDKVLKEVAHRLLFILKERGMLFRFSQDRFVFVLDQYNDSSELVTYANDMETIFSQPFRKVDDHQYIHSKIAIIEVDQVEKVDSILRNASIALDHNKETDGHYTFFNQHMSAALERENDIEKILLEALENEDESIISLVFQPIISTYSMNIIGFETLARMQTEKYGFISPEEFIGVAEKNC
ncbi:diguanylate cyclase [Mycoplasmatota bacterium]|nr:diguanylate cyclase [Mycoplasmatota bacterium]